MLRVVLCNQYNIDAAKQPAAPNQYLIDAMLPSAGRFQYDIDIVLLGWLVISIFGKLKSFAFSFPLNFFYISSIEGQWLSNC